jgi:hypothetical protein
MSEYYVSACFTDGELWALLYALDVLGEQTYLTNEQWELVESAKTKLIDAANTKYLM